MTEFKTHEFVCKIKYDIEGKNNGRVVSFNIVKGQYDLLLEEFKMVFEGDDFGRAQKDFYQCGDEYELITNDVDSKFHVLLDSMLRDTNAIVKAVIRQVETNKGTKCELVDLERLN